MSAVRNPRESGRLPRVAGVAASAIAVALGVLAPPAAAQGPDEVIPAGIACAFTLGLSTEGGNIQEHEFTDPDGNTGPPASALR